MPVSRRKGEKKREKFKYDYSIYFLMFPSEGENIALLSLKAWHTDLDKLLLQYGAGWDWGGLEGKYKMFCGII